MKNAVLPLRLAAGLSLLFAAGHTLGGLKSWSPVGANEVLTSMQTVRFDVSGVSRTFFDFYLGFGSTLSVFLLAEAVLLWQVATLARVNPRLARPFVWTFFLSSLPMGVLTWKFLFPTPVYFDAGLTLLLGWAVAAVSQPAPAEALHREPMLT